MCDNLEVEALCGVKIQMACLVSPTNLETLGKPWCSSAFPAESLRLDRPLLLSRVFRFAPINANCAPLTAWTAARLAPPGRVFALYAPLVRRPYEAKNETNEGSFSHTATQQT